jgi:hypothetical protein
MRNFYMVHYPRNLCNEYAVYVGSRATLDRLAEILDSSPRSENGNLCRINRRRAIYSRANPREPGHAAAGSNGSAVCRDGPGPGRNLAEMLADARKATGAEVDQAEAYAEAVATWS